MGVGLVVCGIVITMRFIAMIIMVMVRMSTGIFDEYQEKTKEYICSHIVPINQKSEEKREFRTS